jgi:hypothetical protein
LGIGPVGLMPTSRGSSVTGFEYDHDSSFPDHGGVIFGT